MKPAIAVLALATLAAGASSPGSAQSAACRPGVHRIGGGTYQTYCGPASASVTLAGRTIRFRGGRCQHSRGLFVLRLGTFPFGNAKPRFDYFGISTVGAVSVAWYHKARINALERARVRLNAAKTRGTFRGSLIGGGRAHGSFRCR